MLTAENFRPGDSRTEPVDLGEVLDGDVIRVLAVMTTALLRVLLAPGQDEQDASSAVAAYLQALGLEILTRAAR